VSLRVFVRRSTQIERHIAYIDARLEEYNAVLAKEDGDSSEKKT
jgi:hypothetical protein